MQNSITTWIAGLRSGDSGSQQHIWNAYFQQLVELARRKLRDERRRDFDEEDIALSAFNSFFRAVEERRLPKLDDRLDLWKVLIVITSRKISTRRKYMRAAKRGSGQVRGESIFMQLDSDDQDGLQQALATEPAPEVATEVAESFGRMMEQLPNAILRQVAQLKLEGYSNREIAARLNCVERTVERKLERIRAVWLELASLPDEV